MANNFIQKGDVINFTAGANLTGGNVLLLGNILGVIAADYTSGDTDCELLLTGVYELSKLSTDTPGAGDVAYWDVGNARVTTTASTHKTIGIFTKAYGSGTTTAHIRLGPISLDVAGAP